jgi:hypothetical protein
VGAVVGVTCRQNENTVRLKTEDEGITFIRNCSKFLPVYTEQHPRRLEPLNEEKIGSLIPEYTNSYPRG